MRVHCAPPPHPYTLPAMANPTLLLLLLALTAPAAARPPEALAARIAAAGDYRKALRHLERTEATARTRQDPVRAARLAAHRARLLVDRGDFAAAQALLEDLDRRALTDPEARALHLLARGLLSERRQNGGRGGDENYVAAARAYDAARALVDTHALPLGAMAHFRSALILERRGDDAGADARYVEVARRARDTGDTATLAFVHLHRANILRRAGRLPQAREGQAQARETARSANHLFVHSVARVNLAAMAKGTPTQSQAAAEARAVARELERSVQNLPGLLDTARVYALETAADLSRGKARRALLREALAQAERSDLQDAVTDLRAALARPAP